MVSLVFSASQACQHCVCACRIPADCLALTKNRTHSVGCRSAMAVGHVREGYRAAQRSLCHPDSSPVMTLQVAKTPPVNLARLVVRQHSFRSGCLVLCGLPLHRSAVEYFFRQRGNRVIAIIHSCMLMCSSAHPGLRHARLLRTRVPKSGTTKVESPWPRPRSCWLMAAQGSLAQPRLRLLTQRSRHPLRISRQ
jgi:hypothetical protein